MGFDELERSVLASEPPARALSVFRPCSPSLARAGCKLSSLDEGRAHLLSWLDIHFSFNLVDGQEQYEIF